MLFFKKRGLVRIRRRLKRGLVRRRRRSTQNAEHFNIYKESARALVHERLAYWNQFYNHTYKRVAIRNQCSRWGSCSTLGNLNFNYRIALLPVELADYVIVHELCHLKEFNHAQPFWDLVAQTIPDYKARKQKLKELSIMLVQGASITPSP